MRLGLVQRRYNDCVIGFQNTHYRTNCFSIFSRGYILVLSDGLKPFSKK
jgi:hypothetical protein